METVTIKSFDNYFSANIYLTKLQDGGIECYLKDEYTVTIDPILSNAIGGIKLVVKKEDAEEALQLVKQFDDDYMKSAKCPKCGATDFAYIAKPGVGNFVTAIFTWLFSSYAIAPNYVYQCGNCGYETETLPDSSTEENPA
jgi:predicted nucleic acid-binding Zn ribbon protein